MRTPELKVFLKKNIVAEQRLFMPYRYVALKCFRRDNKVIKFGRLRRANTGPNFCSRTWQIVVN